jgi:hypothetical protein
VSRLAASALAAIFIWAAVVKLLRKPDLTPLGLPSWSATALAVVELLLAIALCLAPSVGGVLALAMLAGFTTFLVRRRDSGVGCGCFGGASTKPVSNRDLLRNAVLMALAAIAAFA